MYLPKIISGLNILKKRSRTNQFWSRINNVHYTFVENLKFGSSLTKDNRGLQNKLSKWRPKIHPNRLPKLSRLIEHQSGLDWNYNWHIPEGLHRSFFCSFSKLNLKRVKPKSKVMNTEDRWCIVVPHEEISEAEVIFYTLVWSKYLLHIQHGRPKPQDELLKLNKVWIKEPRSASFAHKLNVWSWNFIE